MVQDRDGADVWIVSIDGSGEARRITRGADARLVRWPPGDLLYASGGWGGQIVEVRSVSPGTGVIAPLVPPVALGAGNDASGDFDITRDAELVAITISERRGDLWLLQNTENEF